jgi:hypothetical protein
MAYDFLYLTAIEHLFIACCGNPLFVFILNHVPSTLKSESYEVTGPWLYVAAANQRASNSEFVR